MRRLIRKGFLKLCYRAGIIDLWRYRHRRDIVILMLHGTADPRQKSEWTPLRQQLSPEYLDWCLTLLKRFYRFVSLEEAVAALRGETPPIEHGFVITFDDGYRNNVDDALPVLRKHGAPMSVFLTVSNVENRTPLWADRLDYALQHASVDEHVFRIGGKACRFSRADRNALKVSYEKFRRLVKGAYEDESRFMSKIEEVIAHFERSNGRNLVDLFERDPWSAILSWDEIGRVQANGVCFGSHTMDHYRLGYGDEKAVRYQLAESKRMIEQKTGRKCRYLAYPMGVYSDEAAAIARECGYDAALTTVEGVNRIGCDLMTLKRVHVPATYDAAEFLAHVSGFSAAVSRLNKAVGG